jgi:hypothetical protein
MDYSKSGGPKNPKNPTRHQEGKPSGPAKPPGGRLSKEELLARLKASAESKKPE